MINKTLNFTYLDNAKQRLDIFLTEQIHRLSRSQIQKNIKSGNVLINEEVVKEPHHWLKQNDNIVWQYADTKELVKQTIKAVVSADIELVAETKNYIIINKPAGLLSHPTQQNPTAHSLLDWLAKHWPQTAKLGEDPLRPGLVHRLDKDVSGIMIVPLNQNTYEYLQKQFKLRKVDKTYLALANGRFDNREGIIKLPISRSKNSGRMAAHSKTQGGKTAITRYEVKKQFTNYALLEINIETGRTNQIRVHLQALGHGLVGDRLYYNKNSQPDSKLHRVWLHAAKLSFTESSGQSVTYEAGLPKELNDYLKTIE